jgi:hypothetical protein
VDSVIDGDRQKIHNCVRPLHISMTLHNILHRPVRTVWGVARYYVRECAVVLSPRSLQAVCFLGQDGRGNAAFVEELMPLLGYSAMIVERRQFGPQISRDQELSGERFSTETPGEPRSGSLVTMARIGQWLLREWRSRFEKKKGSTLRISDGYRYELLIDLQGNPKRIPTWFTRLIANLLPSSDLWILLDSYTSVQSGGQAQPAGKLQQLNSYRAFLKTRRKHAILDTSDSSNCVTERAYAAVIGALIERADRALKNRF